MGSNLNCNQAALVPRGPRRPVLNIVFFAKWFHAIISGHNLSPASGHGKGGTGDSGDMRTYRPAQVCAHHTLLYLLQSAASCRLACIIGISKKRSCRTTRVKSYNLRLIPRETAGLLKIAKRGQGRAGPFLQAANITSLILVRPGGDWEKSFNISTNLSLSELSISFSCCTSWLWP